MENRKFGYIRVSSRDQNEGRQLQSMEEAGISPRDIFIDKQSGKNFNREQYRLMKRMMHKGDILQEERDRISKLQVKELIEH